MFAVDWAPNGCVYVVCRVLTLTHTRICPCVLPVRVLSVCVGTYERVCACVQMRPALSACPRPLLGVDAAIRVVASGRCGCDLARPCLDGSRLLLCLQDARGQWRRR